MNNQHIVMATSLVVLCALGGCGLIRNEFSRAPQYRPTLPQYLPAETTPGSLYPAGTGALLFEDIKAAQVGDLLTVLLVERTDARKSSSTSTSKETEVDNQSPTLLGDMVTISGNDIFRNEINGEQSFDGQGSSTQSNRLAGSISVTVTQRLANGDLMVQGEKWLTLNQGQEYVRLAGIVRPTDISTDNTVASDRIAGAQISYSGKGPLNDANRMGFLARFFNSPFALF